MESSPVFTLTGPIGEGDWPGYGPDAANSMANPVGVTLNADAVGELSLKWEVEAPGGVTGTPAIVGGVLYAGDWDGSVRALSVADGAVIWEQKVTDGRIASSVLVTEAVVYAADFDATLHALDRASGEILWSAPIDDRPDVKIFSSPVLAGDLIVVGIVKVPIGDYRLGIVALDAADGTERWRTHTDTGDGETGWSVGVWSTAAVDIDRGLLFIGTGNTNWRAGTAQLADSPYANGLMAMRLSDGEIEWMYRIVENDRADLDVGASPNLFTLAGRDVVGIGGKSGDYAVVDRDTGEQIWKVHLSAGSPMGGIYGSAVSDGVIYISTNRGMMTDARLIALDAADGSVLWRTPLSSPNLAAPTYANGVVYVTTSGVSETDGLGHLYAVDASNGAVLWNDALPSLAGGVPSVAGGTVYVGVGFGFPPAMLPDPNGAILAFSLPQES